MLERFFAWLLTSILERRPDGVRHLGVVDGGKQ